MRHDDATRTCSRSPRRQHCRAPASRGATRIDGTGALPGRKEAPRLFGKRGDRSLLVARQLREDEYPCESAFVHSLKNQPTTAAAEMPVRPQSEVNEVERTYTLIQYTLRPATRILRTVVLTEKGPRLSSAILTGNVGRLDQNPREPDRFPKKKLSGTIGRQC